MSKIITTGMLNGSVGGIPINTSLPCSPDNYNRFNSRNVAYVVMHYTGNSADKAKNNANYFHNGYRGASAHFFVDEDSFYQSVRLCDRAWHCEGADEYFHNTCRNANSIGIEMCTSGNYKVSAKTKENAAQLCAYICGLLGVTSGDVDTFVLRHWDVSHKECPAQMAGSGNKEWADFKVRVKDILNKTNSKEEVDMTKEEVKKLIQEESAKAVKAALDKQNAVYNTIEDVPDYWRDDIQALMDKEIIKGTGNGKLGLTYSETKMAVIVKRAMEQK